MSIFSRFQFLNDKNKKKELLLGLLTGVLVGFSYPPFPIPYLIFIAFIPFLFVFYKREGLGEINRYMYFTGFVYNLITLYWVGSWTKDADPFLMISGLTLLFFNPITFLIPTTLYYFAKKIFNKKIALFLLPLFWVGYEYAYSITDFKFPWLLIGNSVTKFTSYIQISDIIGVHGLTPIILYANIFIFYFFKKLMLDKVRKPVFIVVGILLIILPVIYGIIKISNYEESDKKIKVGLIQPDLNPTKKWEAGNLDEQIDLYFELSDEAIQKGVQLVVWPETALPVYLMSGGYKEYVERLYNYADSNNITILTGMPDATFYYPGQTMPEDVKPTKQEGVFFRSYNSILMFEPGVDSVQKYGKMKLVPFGEKVPLVDELPFLGDFLKWNVGISSWNTGKDTTVFISDKHNTKVNIGGVICIESIYPDFVTAFVDRGADFIAIVTNDSWYGNSSGPYQHQEISILRAVENKRALVRAANGGISCLIDPLGRIVNETKMFTKDVLVVDVPLENEKTFYTSNPLIIPYLSSIVCIWIIGLFYMKKLNTKKI